MMIVSIAFQSILKIVINIEVLIFFLILCVTGEFQLRDYLCETTGVLSTDDDNGDVHCIKSIIGLELTLNLLP